MSGGEPDAEVVHELVDLLLDHGRADKELGQHFLINAKCIAWTCGCSTDPSLFIIRVRHVQNHNSCLLTP